MGLQKYGCSCLSWQHSPCANSPHPVVHDNLNTPTNQYPMECKSIQTRWPRPIQISNIVPCATHTNNKRWVLPTSGVRRKIHYFPRILFWASFLTVFRFDGGRTKVCLSSLSKILGWTVELDDIDGVVLWNYAPCPTSQYGGFPVVSIICTWHWNNTQECPSVQSLYWTEWKARQGSWVWTPAWRIWGPDQGGASGGAAHCRLSWHSAD